MQQYSLPSQHLNSHQRTIQVPMQIPAHRPVGVPHKQSQVTNPNTHYYGHPSQRISTVSSQKMSIATRPDLYTNSTVLSSQTLKSEAMVRNYSERNISTPQKSSRMVVIQNPPAVINTAYQVNSESRPLSQHQGAISVAYGIPSSSQLRVNHYTHTETNPYQHHTPINIYSNHLETSMILPNLHPTISAPYIQSTPVKIDTLIPSHIKPTPHIEVHSLKQSTVQAGPPLIGGVSIQNFQLPPRIRTPPKRINNRLYKSAVYGRTAHSVRPVSRAHSTTSYKAKKRDVLIRCPHRSFISNKKIPVIGGYVSNDKSKTCLIRQMSEIHCPKVLTSKVIGMELIEVIPTEIIKIPIGKTDEMRQSQALQGSMMFDDIRSLSENPILDQPTLIKHYSPEKSISYGDRKNVRSLDQSVFSNRSNRLGDNIKISVYRSPNVVIKKPEIITTGPKLSKQHILRVSAECKVVSPQKYGFAKRLSPESKKSNSPGARYQQKSFEYNLHSGTPTSNPYVKKDVSSILDRLKKETAASTTRENFHMKPEYVPTLHVSPSPKIQVCIEQSPIYLIESQNLLNSKRKQPVFSTSNFVIEEVKERINSSGIHTRTSIQFNNSQEQHFNIQNQAVKRQSDSSYSHNESIKNIYKQPLNNLFEPSVHRSSEHTQIIEIQQTLQYLDEGQNLSKYKIDKHRAMQLSEELEQDLRKFRAENERRKQELNNWNPDFSKKWSNDLPY